MELQHIKEYISTDDGTEGTLLIPKLILSTLVQDVEKTLIPREMAMMVLGPNQIKGSTTTLNLESLNSMNKPREVGEGAEIPLDNVDFTTVTITPKKYGVAVRITREMIEDAQFPIFERNLATVGRRFAELETELILTQLDNASTDISGGAAITVANITEAMQGIEDNDFTPTDMLIGNEVLNDLRNIDTFVEAQKVGNTDMIQRGFQGTLYGLNVARFSTNAAPSSTYAKYAYVFDRKNAYLIAIKRDITVENFTLPSFDMQGAAVTWRGSVNLVRSQAVARITTS